MRARLGDGLPARGGLRRRHRGVERIERLLADASLPGARKWRLIEEGTHYDTIEADSLKEALAVARENVDRASYPTEKQRTIWIDYLVVCDETGEEGSGTVECPAEEPDCDHDDGHDWQAPYELVGGIKDNPGVWGHGGGVIINEACLRCGCGRKTDTWAQRPGTGQRLTSVSYEIGEYADRLDEIEK